ncbi:MAG TPA: aldolase/citrate lyase family protein [bacterium]|nr:aldolase/citrate lyase family protein [bacterium]
MSETKERYCAGRDQKGDVWIEWTPAPTREIHLQSSVKALFGPHLLEVIDRTLIELGLADARVVVQDQGALDFVIAARLEAAVGPVTGKKLALTARAAAAPQRKRLRRTRLYLPGNNPDLMINAGLYGADCLILDLEDSVAPAEKAAARILVRHALAHVDFGASERIVRVNPLSSPYGGEDLDAIVPMAPDALLIPKCESRTDILNVEELIASLEKRFGLVHPIPLIGLIESAKGVVNAAEIALACDRLAALCFGAEDFSADIGAERTTDGRESFVARCQVLLAAKAAGLQALDTVYANVQDEAGLTASAQEAVALGFDGKGVIHPSQIKPIHQVFCPTAEQIDKAQRIVAAMEEALATGSGVTALNGKMIDAPVLMRAERTLALAKEYGLL